MPSWDRYLHWRDRFEEALDARLYPINYLDSLIWSDRAKLWANGKAAIVAQLRRYPGGAVVLEGLIAAGDLAHVKTLVAAAEAWGRAHGAILARIESRSGWLRALRESGYSPHQSTLMKEL